MALLLTPGRRREENPLKSLETFSTKNLLLSL